MEPPFRVKICGITNVDDALTAVAAGADAIGLNFYSRSSRYVALADAKTIANAVRGQVKCIGVFVNATNQEVAEIAKFIDLDAIQFHGDETIEYLTALRREGDRLGSAPFIRAFRCRDADYRDIATYVNYCGGLRVPLSAALIDAFVPGSYGGGGASIDWSAFRQARTLFADTPLILAGGLTPANIDAAIAEAAPDGVDVASGVESQPGRKDPVAVEQFVAHARQGLGLSAK